MGCKGERRKSMKIIEPSAQIIQDINGEEILKQIEIAGRVCYKSEDKITADSARRFVKQILDRGHEAVIEHYNVTVKFICDRGVTHEIVRHRLASYAQESTRYCNYNLDKFNKEITFINPLFWEKDTIQYQTWLKAMAFAEDSYLLLIKAGASAQEARSVLPNSLKTEIVMTCNMREWRHFFKLRTASAAHPQMRQVAIQLLKEFQEKIPILFDDIKVTL